MLASVTASNRALPTRGDVLDDEQDQGGLPCSTGNAAGIEEHALGAEVRKRVRDLEVVEGAVVGQNRVQQVPQGGDIPLAVPQVVEPVRLGLPLRGLEALVKSAIRHEHVHGGIQHHERDPQRVHDALGVEQDDAGHLLQRRGSEVVRSQRRQLVAQGEQVINAGRGGRLVMVHDGTLSLLKRFLKGDASG